MGAQIVPLFIEQVLPILLAFDTFGILFTGFGKGGGVAHGQGFVPASPTFVSSELLAQHHEQRIVVEPIVMIGAELLERVCLLRSSITSEGTEGGEEQRQLPFTYFVVIDSLFRKVRMIFKILFREETFFDKQVRTDEDRFAGKCRKRLIGRVAASNGPERKYLPESNTSRGAVIGEMERSWSEVSNAVRRR